jgi:hypothetical protein
MSDETKPRPEPSDTNPFAPPVAFETPRHPKLGIAYWLPLMAFAAFSVFAIFSFQPVAGWGALGVVSSFFAGMYGLFFQQWLAVRGAAGMPVNRVSDFALSLFSIFLGGVATIAGSIAFMVTCIPASVMLGAGLYKGLPPATTVIVWGGCGTIAITLASWMIRLFIPRKPDP